MLRQNLEYDDAIEELNQGLEQRRLPSNVDLLVEKGRVYFDERDDDLADAQAALALYVDPRTEAAHQLRIAVSRLRRRTGRAVLQAQELPHVPAAPSPGWLLGDARRAEGNDHCAVSLFAEAPAAEDPAARRDALLARASPPKRTSSGAAPREDLTSALAVQDDDVDAGPADDRR